MVKTQEEIENLRRAVEITDDLFLKIKEFTVAGKKEIEVYDYILEIIKESEADTFSFEPIVASGPNGAEPHHKASDYVIQEGELVVVDFGVFYKGMASDMTRMIAIGEISEEQYEIYEIVREALETAIKIIRGGTKIANVDLMARDTIQWHGYLEYFIHTTGHGLGKEVHETPMVFYKTGGRLRAGEVITVEPGIYIPGFMGVRLEQDVLVKEDGYEVLNKSSLDL